MRKFEDLFDGTLGTWNTKPMDLELKDDTKTVFLSQYPVTRLHKAMIRKEVNILVSLGILKSDNGSEWGALSFAKPKAKKNQILFLRNLRQLNRQLKNNPHSMPKIYEMLLKLEGFNYSTSLDLNMGYYPIYII